MEKGRIHVKDKKRKTTNKAHFFQTQKLCMKEQNKHEKRQNHIHLPPPPFMILSSKLKICQSHSDKCCHDYENNENNEQNAVDGVYSVPPYTCKDIVKFNVNSTERQKSSHHHLGGSSSVPRQRWNFPGIFCCPNCSLELSLTIFTSYTTQHKQR